MDGGMMHPAHLGSHHPRQMMQGEPWPGGLQQAAMGSDMGPLAPAMQPQAHPQLYGTHLGPAGTQGHTGVQGPLQGTQMGSLGHPGMQGQWPAHGQAQHSQTVPRQGTLPPGGTQAPHVGPMVPATLPAGGPGFEVLAEDCAEEGMRPTVMGPGGAPHHTKSRSKKEKVYLQNDRDSTQFKKVSKDQLRRSETKDSAGAESHRTLHVSLPHHTVPEAVIASDPDAARLLLWDPHDVEVCDLLTRARHAETATVLLFFTCQAILAGLAVATAMVAIGTADAPDSLMVLLSTLKPGLSRITVALAEVSLVGSLLRAFRTFDGFMQSRSSSSEQLSSAGRSTDPRLVLSCALHVAMNFAVMLCCLLGTHNDVLLLQGSWPGSGSWDAEFAAELLIAQTVMGLLALVFALPEVSDLIWERQFEGPAADAWSRAGGISPAASTGKAHSRLDSSLMTVTSSTTRR